MIILLDFQPMAEYYEKNRNKEFLAENFSSNRSRGPSNILKVSAKTNGFFLRYRMLKKWTIFRAFVRKYYFFTNVLSRKRNLSFS